jgi:DNA-binding GntR family transcriptional regulator
MPGMKNKARPDSRAKVGRSRGTGSHRAYEALWRRIVTLEMNPGADVDETTLVRELGLSRTPVREALIRLASEGLITLAPNRGASVSPMEFSRVQENLEALDLLQRAATRLAAERRTAADIAAIKSECDVFERAARLRDPTRMIEANWDFHAAISRASHNAYIDKHYKEVLVDGLRIARLAMAYECYGSETAYRRHVDKILREHREMTTLITLGNADKAEAVAASHAKLARIRVTEYFEVNGTSGIAIAHDGVARRRART